MEVNKFGVYDTRIRCFKGYWDVLGKCIGVKPLVLDKCIGASLTFNNSICVHKLICVHMHDEAIGLFTKSSQTTMLLRDHLIDWEVKSVHLKKNEAE